MQTIDHVSPQHRCFLWGCLTAHERAKKAGKRIINLHIRCEETLQLLNDAQFNSSWFVNIAKFRNVFSVNQPTPCILRKKLVPDKAAGPYEFTDGCGLMSEDLAKYGACREREGCNQRYYFSKLSCYVYGRHELHISLLHLVFHPMSVRQRA